MELKIQHRSGSDWPQAAQASYSISHDAWIVRLRGQYVVGSDTQDENEALAHAQRLNEQEIS